MPFVKVTASFGEVRATEGIYSETSAGVWDQISPANGYSLESDSTNWFLLLDATSIAQDDASGDDTSPATGVWTGYTVEYYAAPGEIADTPASPSAPGQLPSIGGGSSVVTSPGSITPQAPGSPTAPGAVSPVAPGVPDQPENYVGTFTQTLPGDRKERARQNIGAVGPINVLVIGQSNIANGRDGGDISTSAGVKIWVEDDNPNASVSEFQAWDLSLDPSQHSNPWLVANVSTNPNWNKWSHGLAKRLHRATRRPIHIVQAAESGRALEHWITTANGGTQLIWDYLVRATTNSGIQKYDLLIFDHGESGEGTMGGGYEAALRLLRTQLEAAGYLDDETTVLTRTIQTPVVNSELVEQVFITERNNNGYRVAKEVLEWVAPGDLHITGESHDLVAQTHFDYLQGQGQFGLAGSTNYEDAVLTGKPSTEGFVLLQVAGELKKIPASAFLLANEPYPATPDLVFYGEDYVATSEQIVAGGTTLALEAGDPEPTVDATIAALNFDTSISEFRAPGAVLSNTGDWLIGLRFKANGSRAVTRRILAQDDLTTNSERLFFHWANTGRFQIHVGGSPGVFQIIPDPVFDAVWYSVLIRKSGDNLTVTISGDAFPETDYAYSGTNLRVQNAFFSIGGNPAMQADLRKVIVYDRAVTTDEITAVKAWLNSL